MFYKIGSLRLYNKQKAKELRIASLPMAVTRSGRVTAAQPKKVKFSEDGEYPDAEVLSSNSASKEAKEESQEDGTSESDEMSDEAPEEESTTEARETVLAKLKEQEKAAQQLKKQEKERRKQKDIQFRQQQEQKRQRLQSTSTDTLPEFVPDDVLSSADEDVSSRKQTVEGGRHLRAADFEKEQAIAKKRMKLEKLQHLKEMKKQAIQKGPVYVQVQSDLLRNRVPRADKSVLDSKNSWLQRKALNRK